MDYLVTVILDVSSGEQNWSAYGEVFPMNPIAKIKGI